MAYIYVFQRKSDGSVIEANDREAHNFMKQIRAGRQYAYLGRTPKEQFDTEIRQLRQRAEREINEELWEEAKQQVMDEEESKIRRRGRGKELKGDELEEYVDNELDKIETTKRARIRNVFNEKYEEQYNDRLELKNKEHKTEMQDIYKRLIEKVKEDKDTTPPPNYSLLDGSGASGKTNFASDDLRKRIGV